MAEVALRPVEPIDASTIAPIQEDGRPDMYNFMPTRLVPASEAVARGWPLFYEALPCRFGHLAPRYLSNPRLCVDCKRVAAGKAPIGGTRIIGEYKAYKQRDPKLPAPVMIAAAAPPEPDPIEKRFLVAYASTKDFDGAARAVGVSGAQMSARMSWSNVFKLAVNELETRLAIRQTPSPPTIFEWDESKHARLIEVLVDTGDLATARDSIRVTPSEYFRELERDESFAAAVEAAQPLAAKALEERAIQLSLAGDGRLLQKVLSAKMPEYRDRVAVDMNVTEKLDDRQLDGRLTKLLGKFRGRIFDGEFSELEPERETPALAGPGREEPPGEPESISDLL